MRIVAAQRWTPQHLSRLLTLTIPQTRRRSSKRSKLSRFPKPKTLEEQAAEKGAILLDSATVQILRDQAAAGALAAKQLQAERFERAFDSALTARKVVPAEKDGLKHFYELDAEATIKLLEDRQPILPGASFWRPSDRLEKDMKTLDEADRDQLVRAGVLPDSALLQQKIEKFMLDAKLPQSAYAKVLDQYMSGEIKL